jgi:hypothetical protein
LEDKRDRWDYGRHGLRELNQDSYRRHGRRGCRYEKDLAMAALGLMGGVASEERVGSPQSTLIRGLAKKGAGALWGR